MPDEARPSVFRRMLDARPRARMSLVVALAAVGLLGALSAVASTAASSGGAAAPAPAAETSLRTLPRSEVAFLAGLGALPGLNPNGAAAGDATAGWTKIVTATATPTAVPPSATPTATPTRTATPVPPAPTATPRVVRQAPPAPTQPPPTSTPAPPPPPATAGTGLDTSPMDGPSQKLFDMTNKRRIDSGLPPLRPNGLLVGIARIRSRDMADHNYFAHLSPITGDNAFTLMDRHGVPYGWGGENLAKNNYPDADTVGVAEDALWNSPPHRENILNPHYTDMGIALVVDATGMNYFTIIFTGPA
jgi:uncharacterized protein YkwD